MLLDVDDVRQAAVGALSKVAPPEAAKTQVEILMDAELRGIPSHGLLRLPRIIKRIENGVICPEAKGRHVWEREAFLSVDGERGLGPVVALTAIEALEERVGVTGVAVAAIRNSNHLGMLGWYAEKAAMSGRTMIALTTSEALVHPWGGRHAMLGTNPIAIGVPTEGEPFMMDTATSLVSMGEIHDHAERSVPIPGHWALDASGNPTTDASAAKLGSIAPFGQAKGFALGLAFELLVTSLAGSAIGTAVKGTLDDTEACNKGDVFILLDGPRPELKDYLDGIRAAEPAEGFAGVLIPGERGRKCRAQRLIEGIKLPYGLWSSITMLAGGRTGGDSN